MTRFEELKNMNIDEFAEWINKDTQCDDSAWMKWWDSTYCKNCESIRAFVPYLNGEHECAWCEVNGKCRFFPNMSGVPSCKDIVKLWLESEVG